MAPFPGHAKCWIAELQAQVRHELTRENWSPAKVELLRAPACSGVLIRAHLIPKQRIERELRSRRARLMREGVEGIGSLLVVPKSLEGAVIWDPRVWVPMCGGPMGNAGHHGMLDSGGVNRIKLERAWIPEPVEAFAVEYGLEWSLEADYGPKETDMTFEEMQEIAREVVAALAAAGFGNPEYLEQDAKPGDPLPIAFISKNGDELALALDVL